MIGPCKTPRSRRTIVIPESVTALLAEYAAQRPPTRSPIFFLSPRRHAVRAERLRVVLGKVRGRAADIMWRDAEELHDPFAEHAGDELAGRASTTCATRTRPSCYAPACTSRSWPSASATARPL